MCLTWELSICINSLPCVILNTHRLAGWGVGRVWAEAWRACQLSIRLLKNLGNRDLPQIEDRLVFSCLRIIRWWRDVMRSWIPDLISTGFYSSHPCPWTLLPRPQLSPRQLSFVNPTLLLPRGPVCARCTISSSPLALGTSHRPCAHDIMKPIHDRFFFFFF